jgi:uncharacterized repeat protein (TIGR02543 family)
MFSFGLTHIHNVNALYSGTTPYDLAVGAKTGDSRVILTTADHGYVPGMILQLDRRADDAPATAGGSEWPNGHNQFMRSPSGGMFGPGTGDGYRPISQQIEIERVDGAILYLSNRINIDFPLVGARGSLNPQVWNTRAHEYKYMGVESVKVQATAGYSDSGEWSWHLPVFNYALGSSYCWVKNIESDGAYFSADGRGFMGRHAEVNGFRNHITGVSAQNSSQIHPGGNGYGIRYHGTDCVIDNNICNMLNKPLPGQTTGGGNVVSYNYVPNAVIVWNEVVTDGSGRAPNSAAWPNSPQNIQYGANESAFDMSHGGYSHSDLLEGNWSSNIHTDGTSGNGWFTIFRNHSFGSNLRGAMQGTRAGISIAGGNNEHVSIGNVFLNPANADGARVWRRPGETGNSANGIYVYQIETGDLSGSGLNAEQARQWAYDRFYQHYDYNYVDNAILKDAANTFELPDSLYLESAPKYFSDAGMAWPPVNPDGATHEERVGDLPSVARYENRLYFITFSGNGSDFFTTRSVLLPAKSVGGKMPADPEKDGYVFDGWNTEPDGSGAAFTAGTALAFAAPPTLEAMNSHGQNMTVYAQWKPDEGSYLVSAEPSASVKKLTGNTNDLTITVTEFYSDGEAKKVTVTISIANNAAGTYAVGNYKVYVDTKGNTQIRDCRIVG